LAGFREHCNEPSDTIKGGVPLLAERLPASQEVLCSIQLGMEQSPVLEAISRSLRQEISRLLWNQEAHYNIHKR
jgi:hypothetical protein